MDTQFTRSSSDKMMAGVCGGLARYFGIDATIVRLVFALTVLVGGVSPLVYLVLWIVMPLDRVAPQRQALPLQDMTGEWQYDPYTGQRIQK